MSFFGKNKKKSNYQWALAIATFVFGLLLVMQYNTSQVVINDLESQSTDDLASVVISLNERRNKLENELDDVNNYYDSLNKKVDGGEDLTLTMDNNIKKLQIANGMLDVTGQGVIIDITGESYLRYLDLVDIVNELWNAGAEAISINNIRINANTLIKQVTAKESDNIITVDGATLLAPVVIKAIGNSDTLEKALTFPGGIKDQLNTYQVYPNVKKSEKITILANKSEKSQPQYMQENKTVKQ